MSKPIIYYADLSASDAISEMDRELSPEKQGEFYRWLDETHNGLFSIEAKLLDKACDDFINSEKTRRDREELILARARYFKVLINKMTEFRLSKNVDECDDFINSLIKGV